MAIKLPFSKPCGLAGPTHSTAAHVTPTVARDVVRPTASTTDTAATSMREEVLQRVHELETAAADAHRAAQELNKQGKFQEAAEMYARMRKLDADALDATQALGCPSCRVSAAERAGAPGYSQATDASPVYQQLHQPAPWPTCNGECTPCA